MFKIYKISDVNIYTDYSPTNTSATFKDSIQYNNFNLFSVQKLKYKPKAITDAVFITKGSLFSDLNSVFQHPTQSETVNVRVLRSTL